MPNSVYYVQWLCDFMSVHNSLTNGNFDDVIEALENFQKGRRVLVAKICTNIEEKHEKRKIVTSFIE